VSKALLGCHEVLNTLGDWISGHSDFIEIAKADEFTKLFLEAAFIVPEPPRSLAHGEAKRRVVTPTYG